MSFSRNWYCLSHFLRQIEALIAEQESSRGTRWEIVGLGVTFRFGSGTLGLVGIARRERTFHLEQERVLQKVAGTPPAQETMKPHRPGQGSRAMPAKRP